MFGIFRVRWFRSEICLLLNNTNWIRTEIMEANESQLKSSGEREREIQRLGQLKRSKRSHIIFDMALIDWPHALSLSLASNQTSVTKWNFFSHISPVLHIQWHQLVITISKQPSQECYDYRRTEWWLDFGRQSLARIQLLLRHHSSLSLFVQHFARLLRGQAMEESGTAADDRQEPGGRHNVVLIATDCQ